MTIPRYADPMEFSEALGSVIREHREAHVPKLTQGDLGAAAGYQTGASVSISRIESGLMSPSPGKLEAIARVLGVTSSQLEQEAAKRTWTGRTCAGKGDGNGPRGDSIKDRVERVQQEIGRRTSLITERAEAFNEAHDRARDDFFVRFVDVATGVTGAPQPPDPAALDDEGTADVQAEATNRIRWTSYGVASALAGGAGGAAAGAAVGGAAAYGTFMAAATFGTASTGAAIAGLGGAAATNAALALLGGGTLAAGGAGIAGGTALLAGIAAAPALILAVGGLVWKVRRNRKQQEEAKKQIDAVEAELAATREGFEAVADILLRSRKILDYIAVHAGHALKRWENQLGPRPIDWKSMAGTDRKRYQEFIDISANQLAVATIDVTKLMASRGEERGELIAVAEEVLKQAKATIESLV